MRHPSLPLQTDEKSSGVSLPSRDTHHAGLEMRSQPMVTLMLLSLVILLMQLWLITLAQEEYTADRSILAIPTFIASGVCFLLNLWLLKFVYDIDRHRE